MRIILTALLLSSAVLFAGRKRGYTPVKDPQKVESGVYSTFGKTDKRCPEYTSHSSYSKKGPPKRFDTNTPYPASSHNKHEGCSIQ